MTENSRVKWRLLFAIVVCAALSTLSGCASVPLPSLHGSRSLAVPDVLPLGAVSRAHWHTMETNGEASDFVLYRNEFVDQSSELSPYGRDHIMEIAARLPAVPFPVLVQRSENNSDPELDAARRDAVVRILNQLGNADADSRTVVSQPYSDGINSLEAEQDRTRFRSSRQLNGGFGGGTGF